MHRNRGIAQVAGSLTIILVLPVVLAPIEVFFPYPYLIEEIAKFLVIYWMTSRYNIKHGWWMCVAGMGFAFALSEAVLYVNRILMSGGPILLLKRLMLTAWLHGMTSLVIYFGIRFGKNMWIATLLLAIVIHYIYNSIAFFIL